MLIFRRNTFKYCHQIISCLKYHALVWNRLKSSGSWHSKMRTKYSFTPRLYTEHLLCDVNWDHSNINTRCKIRELLNPITAAKNEWF